MATKEDEEEANAVGRHANACQVVLLKSGNYAVINDCSMMTIVAEYDLIATLHASVAASHENRARINRLYYAAKAAKTTSLAPSPVSRRPSPVSRSTNSVVAVDPSDLGF